MPTLTRMQDQKTSRIILCDFQSVALALAAHSSLMTMQRDIGQRYIEVNAEAKRRVVEVV